MGIVHSLSEQGTEADRKDTDQYIAQRCYYSNQSVIADADTLATQRNDAVAG